MQKSDAFRLPNTCAPPPKATQESYCTRRVEAHLEQAITSQTEHKFSDGSYHESRRTEPPNQLHVHEPQWNSHLPAAAQLALYTIYNPMKTTCSITATNCTPPPIEISTSAFCAAAFMREACQCARLRNTPCSRKPSNPWCSSSSSKQKKRRGGQGTVESVRSTSSGSKRDRPASVHGLSHATPCHGTYHGPPL